MEIDPDFNPEEKSDNDDGDVDEVFSTMSEVCHYL